MFELCSEFAMISIGGAIEMTRESGLNEIDCVILNSNLAVIIN